MPNNAHTFCCKLFNVQDGGCDQWTKQSIQLPVKDHSRHGGRGNRTVSFQTSRFFGTVVFEFAQQRFSEILAVVCNEMVLGIVFESFFYESHYLVPCATAASLFVFINNLHSSRTILVIWIVYVKFLEAI